MFKLLLKNKPQNIINSQIKINNYKNIGCLCYAVLNNSKKIVQYLLTIENINVNLKCVEDKTKNTCITATALHLAVKNNNHEIVSLLLNHPKIRINELMIKKFSFDESGDGHLMSRITNIGSISAEKNALIIAIKNEYEDIVEILLKNNEIDVNRILNIEYSYESIFTF